MRTRSLIAILLLTWVCQSLPEQRSAVMSISGVSLGMSRTEVERRLGKPVVDPDVDALPRRYAAHGRSVCVWYVRYDRDDICVKVEGSDLERGGMTRLRAPSSVDQMNARLGAPDVTMHGVEEIRYLYPGVAVIFRRDVRISPVFLLELPELVAPSRI